MRTLSLDAGPHKAVDPRAMRDTRPFVGRGRDAALVLDLQRMVGNQAMGRWLRNGAGRPLKVAGPDDVAEREADRAAQAPGPEVARAAAVPAAAQVPQAEGRALPLATRDVLEARFGVDLGDVRTHTDVAAARACRRLRARAITVEEHIYFGAGRGPGADELTAHEVAHVVQRRTAGGAEPQLHRKLELRPPGKGEASAFGRAQELIDRLNVVSQALHWELKGRDVRCTVKDAGAMTHFDTVMKSFVDRPELVPMRLVTRHGYIGGGPIATDDFGEGYVDLDDLLADDVYSFESDLLHFLTERFLVKDYARRIGTNLDPLFKKAHRAGKEAEAENLRALFNDPSVEFWYEEEKPNHTWVNAFRSKTNGYQVFQVVKRSEDEVAAGEMWVRKTDGTRVTIDDFRKERAKAGK